MAASLTISVADHGPIAVVITLHVQDPDGIENVIISDSTRRAVPLPEPISGCPAEVVDIPLGSLLRSQLPLNVIVENCNGVEGEERTIIEGVGGPGLPGDLGPSIRLPCSATLCEDNALCTNAIRAASRLRDELATLCRNRARLERLRREALAAMAAALLIMVLTVAALALTVGIPFGWVMALILVLVLAVAIVAVGRYSLEATRLRSQLQVLEARIEEKMAAFLAARDEVDQNCCAQCVFVDLSNPC